ncbi:hypothetical protein AV521_41880 [Streptomyces sp. IMTB 2501]|nr:hypothetical protein AV521_41880 [Streptomyces sp. IMTB 2501]
MNVWPPGTGRKRPHLRRARLFDEGDRGLLIVAQLSQQWGSRHTRAGKTIWAEPPLTPAQAEKLRGSSRQPFRPLGPLSGVRPGGPVRRTTEREHRHAP